MLGVIRYVGNPTKEEMMRKLLILLSTLALWPGTAHATHNAPGSLSLTCSDIDTVFVPYAAGETPGVVTPDHNGVDIYQSHKANPSMAYSTEVLVSQLRDQGLAAHGHSDYYEHPQARTIRYRSRYTNIGGGYSGYSAPSVCTSNIKFAAGAESDNIDVCCGVDQEWADLDEVNSSAAIVTSPVQKGSWSNQCHMLDGNGSDEERCELGMANAPSSSTVSRERLYENGDELWIAFAFYLDDVFAFCQSSCVHPGDGGAIEQTKQLGGCGNPILSMAVARVSGQTYLSQHNDWTADCQTGQNADILWEEEVEHERWIKVLRKIRFDPGDDPDAGGGYIESFIDRDGDAINDFEKVYANTPEGIGKFQSTVTTPSELGGGTHERLTTWTQKVGSDQLTNKCTIALGNWPCNHQRVGLYRSPNRITGESWIWHDSVVAGPTLSSVLNTAF